MLTPPSPQTSVQPAEDIAERHRGLDVVLIELDLDALIARLIYLSAENRHLRRELADRLFATREESGHD